MGNVTPAQQRAHRRRRLHERQAVIYGSLGALLAVAALGGAAVYTDALDLPFLQREFTTPEPEPTVARPDVPCLPDGTLPVPYATVAVAVLNGSARNGLASETANAVTTRGFVVSRTDNYPESIPWPVQISFGAEGLAGATTLAAHLDDPVLLLDDRDGPGVDLVLGEAFTGLVDPATVLLDPNLPMAAAPGCIPLEEALAKAPERLAPPPPDVTPEPGDEVMQDGGEGIDDGTGDGTGDEATEPAPEG